MILEEKYDFRYEKGNCFTFSPSYFNVFFYLHVVIFHINMCCLYFKYYGKKVLPTCSALFLGMLVETNNFFLALLVILHIHVI